MDTLAEVRQAAADVAEARQAAERARERLAEAVRAALAEHKAPQVAEVAGLSAERVYQIRDGRR